MRFFSIFKTGLLIVPVFLMAGCSVWQSAVKSTFPYTAAITIPRASSDDTTLSASADASSFDQRFNKNGNNADKIRGVKIISAKLTSDEPSDFNLGNLSLIKVYLSNSAGNEILVASRTDITPQVGASLVLDIDNAKPLDDFIKDPKVKVRVAYKLRDHIYVTAHLKVALGFRANP